MSGGKVLVTGSSGHLGEALVRTLRAQGRDVLGLDVLDSPFTSCVGSIADRDAVKDCIRGAESVLHTATLHKPHVGTHDRQEFIATNVIGTTVLLEEGVAAGVSRFVFTSTTSAFGRALVPSPGSPAAWITEDVAPIPRNIYGVTKVAAEDVCELVARNHGLPIVVLRTSRFFPEIDDDSEITSTFVDENVKANEYLYRRVDIEDVVSAHLLAEDRAPAVGFAKYVISATSPFAREDATELARDAPAIVRRLFPDQEAEYSRRGWRMFPRFDRVYDNTRARTGLGWAPRYDFRCVLDRLKADRDPRSPLARTIGAKGYHEVTTGPYTVRQG
jgi:nucleoside-diphosphate-sugar epimerase